MSHKHRKNHSRLARLSAVVAVALGVVALSGGIASAELNSDILGGTYVGGGSTGHYSPAQFLPQTFCTGTTNEVKTVVVAAPRSGTGGQWFRTKVYARDITGTLGAWKDYGWVTAWASESFSLAYSMPDPVQVQTLRFTGYDNHYYQIYVETQVAVNGVWQPVGAQYSNHFTSWGAVETNIYGRAIQGLPGTATSYCRVL